MIEEIRGQFPNAGCRNMQVYIGRSGSKNYEPQHFCQQGPSAGYAVEILATTKDNGREIAGPCLVTTGGAYMRRSKLI
jgi:hypothetical protein